MRVHRLLKEAAPQCRIAWVSNSSMRTHIATIYVSSCYALLNTRVPTPVTNSAFTTGAATLRVDFFVFSTRSKWEFRMLSVARTTLASPARSTGRIRLVVVWKKKHTRSSSLLLRKLLCRMRVVVVLRGLPAAWSVSYQVDCGILLLECGKFGLDCWLKQTNKRDVDAGICMLSGIQEEYVCGLSPPSPGRRAGAGMLSRMHDVSEMQDV
jgi:hypothetical protein